MFAIGLDIGRTRDNDTPDVIGDNGAGDIGGDNGDIDIDIDIDIGSARSSLGR